MMLFFVVVMVSSPEVGLKDSSWKVLFLSGPWCENGNLGPGVSAAYFPVCNVQKHIIPSSL